MRIRYDGSLEVYMSTNQMEKTHDLHVHVDVHQSSVGSPSMATV